ncbi:nuclear transport factor 2 family protein, partial [Lutibacter sp.]|uniref:nuclear transport factor 2 family protein n=1 Tax=Lutibacter sp. TaxID=1925666 RepID=UPI0034A031D1
MKFYSLLFLMLLVVSCSINEEKKVNKVNTISEKEAIETVLINWHKNASDANFEAYFNAMSDKSIFIGTDASENWNIE